jgi:hypothetical protein
MNLIKIAVPFYGALFLSCSTISLKPLVTVPTYSNCQTVNDDSFEITQIHKNIMRYHPTQSQTILLNTNWGNPLKTLKVYKFYENGEMKYLLLFHIRERAGDDISNCKKMDLITNGEHYTVDIIQDGSVFIADISDLYFYTTLGETFFKKIIAMSESVFSITTYEFQLNNDCKPLLTF